MSGVPSGVGRAWNLLRFASVQPGANMASSKRSSLFCYPCFTFLSLCPQCFYFQSSPSATVFISHCCVSAFGANLFTLPTSTPVRRMRCSNTISIQAMALGTAMLTCSRWKPEMKTIRKFQQWHHIMSLRPLAVLYWLRWPQVAPSPSELRSLVAAVPELST